MGTIAELKEQAVAETPLVLFDVELANGSTERWSTHAATVGAETYDARVVRHNFFEIQASSDSGIDAIPRIAFTLANADSRFSQIEAATGFKGATLTATFLFYDLAADAPVSESAVVFRGMLNPPETVTETEMRLSAINRMSLQRVLLPPVRIQRRCPWTFPATSAERQEALGGGAEGSYSRFFPCGYSAGEPGGAGNLDSGSPFTSCSFTQADCVERGMFDQDSGLTTTRRFGGIEFVPASILVRGHGERERSASAVASNEARYNDFVPLLYGTVWVEPPVVFARNDGNLTRMEVLLAGGEIEQVVKVLVNDVEIPLGVTGQDMTATGWWNLFAGGGRTGGFNLNFTTPSGDPLGDPYGSMAALSVVVPNQINDGRTLPRVKILAKGLKLERFDAAGDSLGFAFSNNPVWVLLDVLRRSGWRKDEIDLATFGAAADFCDETIAATDNQGNAISIERFRCNFSIRSRRTAADAIRGIRNNARLQLRYGGDGRLAALVENSLLLQQPTKPAGSNAPDPVNGGWPAYAYVDGSTPGVASGILRAADGSPSIRLRSRPIADTPNRFAIEFADRFNEYQQDSLALTDVADVSQTGQEVTGRLVVDGLATFDQAARTLKFFLDKSLQGNRVIELETTVKALGQKVGDIITVTYLKEGLSNQPFRILKLEPGSNYRSVRVTAQIHDDAWYNDTNGQLTLTPATQRPADSGAGLPLTLTGDELDEFGDPQFSIEEFQTAGTDGTILTEVEVGFTPPAVGQSLAVGIPIVDLQSTVLATGGTIAGGQTLYYVVTATDSDGLESNPSFVVRATIPAGGSTYQVQLEGLSFTSATATFSVYRGLTPSTPARIASAQALASTFSDTGLAQELQGAPDPHFHHANFYWRLENTEEQFASSSGPNLIGSTLLAMETNALVGHAVRIIRGQGARQDRTVTANTATELTLAPDWQIEPDASSVFVVSDGAWRFGGRAQTSPARFQVPNLRDRVLEITGRAANAQNVESLEGLAIVSRWRIGGGGLGVADADSPPLPSFGVNVEGDGVLRIIGIGFQTLENTQTITSGKLKLLYRSELNAVSTVTLTAAVDASETTLTLSTAGSAAPSDLIQIGSELMTVDVVNNGGLEYVVTRGARGSTAVAHSSGDPLYHLQTQIETLALEPGIFGTPEATVWEHAVFAPSIRAACAELTLRNQFGDSPTAIICFSELLNNGLRTLQGGQFSLHFEGLLAQLADATTPLVVQTPLAIRDVFAQVKTAPQGAAITLDVRQDGNLIATLTIGDGQTISNSADGAELEALDEGANLSIDLTAVGTTHPGADLTVTIRV